MKQLYRNESSNAKWNAQRNLQGRTHYVDDDTMRFHKSRIIASRDTDNGLLFWLIESCALDMNNSKRGFRFVIFDVFGTVLERPDLESTYSTSDKARKAMYETLNKLDAYAITMEGIAREERSAAREFDDMRTIVTELQKKTA